MNCAKWFALIAFVLFTSVPAANAAPSGTVVRFASPDKSQPYNLSATLYLPDNPTGTIPAVVMVHGTSGVNVVGQLYREPILNAGIAIFEVDFKTGVFTSAMDRPHIETFLPMAFAALKELRKNPAVDPDRIAIMGFSMGGGVTLRTAIEDNRKAWMGKEKGFAAHAAFYPVAKPLISIVEHSSGMTGAPIIIFYGTEDSYGDGTGVPELKSVLKRKFNFDVATVEYAGATHAFNANTPPITIPDPAAIGGRSFIKFDPEASSDSVTKVVAFLRENLAVR
jgi:dienelactone hydrolase